MTSPSLFTDHVLEEPCWEPQPRLFEGKFCYVRHRFPIKGGITANEVWSKMIYDSIKRNNPLFYILQERSLLIEAQ